MSRVKLGPIIAILVLTFQGSVWAAPPSRQFTYTAGEVIEPAEVTANEDTIYEYLQAGVDTYSADTVNSAAITNGTITNVDVASSTLTTSEILNSTLLPEDMANADHGDFTYASNVATLDNDVVAPAEMADADHGELSWSGGVATLDDDVILKANFADEDWGDMTVSSNNVTLDAGVVAANELAATLTMADGDFLDFSASNASTTTDGMRLPQATDCSNATAEGQICWDTDGDVLRIGDGSASIVLSNSPVVGTLREETTIDSTDRDVATVTTTGTTGQIIFYITWDVVGHANSSDLTFSIDDPSGNAGTFSWSGTNIKGGTDVKIFAVAATTDIVAVASNELNVGTMVLIVANDEVGEWAFRVDRTGSANPDSGGITAHGVWWP